MYRTGAWSVGRRCLKKYGKSEEHDGCPVLNHVMCNGFGFGGNDSTVIWGRFEQEKAM